MRPSSRLRQCFDCRYLVPARDYTYFDWSEPEPRKLHLAYFDCFTDCPMCGGLLDDPIWHDGLLRPGSEQRWIH